MIGRILLHHAGSFMDWSTVLDRPATTGMGRDEMIEYLVGRGIGIDEAETALDRAERCGTSAARAAEPGWTLSLEQAVADNRAGDDEAHMAPAELVRRFLVERETLY